MRVGILIWFGDDHEGQREDIYVNRSGKKLVFVPTQNATGPPTSFSAPETEDPRCDVQF
jgi:hypothetical protein